MACEQQRGVRNALVENLEELLRHARMDARLDFLDADAARALGPGDHHVGDEPDDALRAGGHIGDVDWLVDVRALYHQAVELVLDPEGDVRVGVAVPSISTSLLCSSGLMA